ncbi:MAG: hypothetical protein LBT56_05375 [Prevotellaceae bacterium]|jgi:hypothetical protein|nr:hypothetical protein [Prevotellaceae bacterium]
MSRIYLDKYYTKQTVAKKCLALIPDFNSYETIIEPSAGNGVFSKLIKNCIAYDIEPECESIMKQDFLLLNTIYGNKKLFIGNPPFGERAMLAKKFIQHSIALDAETIAFILPDTFSKFLVQKIFPQNWKLIIEEALGRDNFEINGETYHVPCSFFVWTKRETNVNLRKIELPEPTKIKFLPRFSKEADFTINGNSGKVKELSEVTNYKSEHYIKVLYANEKYSIKQQISQLKYNFKSSVNGGNAWISQQEILEAYFNSDIEQIRSINLFNDYDQ